MEDFLMNVLASTPTVGFAVFFLSYRLKKLEVLPEKLHDIDTRVTVVETKLGEQT